MALPVTSNTPATAAQYNALIPKYLRQTADQTLNTTSMTAHNTWASIAVGAGEVWEFCFNSIIASSTAASDVKTDLDVTGTVTTDWRHIISPGVTATASNDIGNVNVQARATTDDVSHGGITSGTVGGTLQEKVMVDGGVSGGTITYRWACVAASGNCVLKAGGHMIAHRVS